MSASQPPGNDPGFLSLKSHFSWSSSSSDTNPDLKSPRESAAAGSLPGIGLEAEDSTRELSEEENDRLNDKIDRLIAVVQERRLLHFHTNVQTGDIDIFAKRRDSRSSGGDQLEAEIANASHNFGNIIPEREMRQTRSLDILDPKTYHKREEGQGTHSDGWRTISSASGSGIVASAPKARKNHQVLRAHEIQAREARGSRWVAMDTPGVIDGYKKVHPVTLNYRKPQEYKTPSVYSGDSELDRSSPSFIHSLRRYKSSNSDIKSIQRWLDTLELVQPEEMPVKGVYKERLFSVLRDYEQLTSSKTTPTAPNVLRDVSNLRKPGYLQHNSFAQENKMALPLRP